MIVLSLILGLLAAAQTRNNCLECHQRLGDSRLSAPARAMRDDTHAQAGLTCAACHGGDPTAEIVGDDARPAKDPRKGFRGKSAITAIPQLCGGCHADAPLMHRYDPNLPVDQLAQYWTSVHGQKLREGATDVAQCVSCHNAHGVLSAKDPRSPVYPTRIPQTCGRCHADAEHMKAYDIATDQLELYRSSVHGRALFDQGDLGAPTCNSCHGNHGAAPPGVTSVSLVCGVCHAIQKELFAASPHKAVFDESGQPECETCHGNHDVAPATDEMLGVAEEAICVLCHDDAKSPPYQTAKGLRDEIEGLKKASAGARETVGRAARAGMEVSDAEIVLIDANQALVEARNLVHASSLEKLAAKTKEGLSLSAKAEEAGRAALAEADYRRRGLSISLIFILMLAAGLYLKIRQMEGRT
jgi:predicted CXXCH cytochrome family protein